MNKTRLLHLAALVLGVLTTVAMLLSMIPNYAAVGAGILLLLADVKKVFPSLAVFALLCLATLLPACATLSKCAPTEAGRAQIAAALAPDNYEAVLEKYAIDFGVCVVNNAVADFVAAHRPAATSAALTGAAVKAQPSPAYVHGQAWLAKHRGEAVLCGISGPS